MKKLTFTCFAVASLIIVACGSSKKHVTTVTKTNTTTTSTAKVKPADGIYEPGEEELTAIKAKYPETSLDHLKEGYTLYTMGACIQCHGAIDIYQYNEKKWKEIVDEMADKAKISDTQKDAVYKYVLAIKAAKV